MAMFGLGFLIYSLIWLHKKMSQWPSPPAWDVPDTPSQDTDHVPGKSG